MSLINSSFFYISSDHLSIFEIYPQSEIPQLTQIAHLGFSSEWEEIAHLLPDTLISRVDNDNRIVFRVVDYRTNYSTFFSADFDTSRITHTIEVYFILSKTLKLASNYLLGRHSRRRQLLCSFVLKKY